MAAPPTHHVGLPGESLITTPATAGPANPVAISNLAISVLHAVTLALLWRQYTERGAGVR